VPVRIRAHRGWRVIVLYIAGAIALGIILVLVLKGTEI
jgi:hypothetical protein